MEIQIDIEKYLCVICQEILTDPVTLPCFHTCCLSCLEKTLDCNKYQCFLCRKFIGSWYRNAKRRNSLINQILSSYIAENFSYLIQEKINLEINGLSSRPPTSKISHPGEIKAEFDSFFQKIEGEKLAQQEKENKLSEEFIQQLKEEEQKLKLEQEELLKCDELIARELAFEINSDFSTVKENLQIQLSSDEEFARKLSGDENLLSEPRSLIFKSGIDGCSNKKLTFVKRSPSAKSKIISPKIEKIKKMSTSVRFGPMDRFIESNTKKWR